MGCLGILGFESFPGTDGNEFMSNILYDDIPGSRSEVLTLMHNVEAGAGSEGLIFHTRVPSVGHVEDRDC